MMMMTWLLLSFFRSLLSLLSICPLPSTPPFLLLPRVREDGLHENDHGVEDDDVVAAANACADSSLSSPS